MNPLIQFKTATLSLLIVFVLMYFGLWPTTQALTPPPDGGYTGGNTAEGDGALSSLSVGAINVRGNFGVDNTALGYQALFSDVTGDRNTATGSQALFHNTTVTGLTGHNNTANGYRALYWNQVGTDNTAVGANALLNNLNGNFNTATGGGALSHNDAGEDNTADGYRALYSNIYGQRCTAVGYQALYSNSNSISIEGDDNTAVGFQALSNNTSGGGNLALGVNAGIGITTANNVIAIGTAAANVSNSCYIGNIWNQAGGSQAVYVNSDGKLGFQTSSGRFKDEIKPMEQASEVIYALKPVSFRYKPEIEPTRPLGFGLVAEDVEKISPDLVTRGGDGRVNTVRYDVVNAMLLNEFLKEHRKVANQQKEIDALKAELKEQRVLIQKVSAQLDTSTSAPRIASNHSR